MKRIAVLLFVCFMCCFLSVESFEWQWVDSAGGDISDRGRDIITDSEGNAYVTGFFHRVITFGNITLTGFSWWAPSVFIAKSDSSGNWLWAVAAGGSMGARGSALALDSEGNLYISGHFYDTITIGTTTLISSGSADIFVAKLNSNGIWQWAVRAGSTSYCYGNGLAVDSDDNLYLSGSFTDTADFGDFSVTSMGGQDIYLAKLDTDGNWLWVRRGGGSQTASGTEVALDSNDNIYISGNFYGSGFFGNTLLTSNGITDVFIAKLNGNGEWIWAESGGGPNMNTVYSIAVDTEDYVYIGGRFRSTASFGNTELISAGSSDAFVAKIDSAGNWQWASRAGGPDSCDAYGLAVDSDNNVYVTGGFTGISDFGDTVLNNIVANWNLFIAKMDSDGNWLWAERAGHYDGTDSGFSIAPDNMGNVYLTGWFTGSALFGTSLLHSEGEDDIFVAKIYDFLACCELGSLSGFVLDQVDNQPLENALVRIEDLPITVRTDETGYFYIEEIPAGDHLLQVSVLGYYDNMLVIIVEEDGHTEINLEMAALPLIAVSGQVTGSDMQGEGFADVPVELAGYYDYTTQTCDEGYFLFPEVMGDKPYALAIRIDGYSDFTTEIYLDDTDFDFGLITVNELALPPHNITAEVTPENDVTITWELPVNVGDYWETGFQGGFLPVGWSVSGVNTDITTPVPGYWTVNNFSNSDITPFGDYHIGLWWSHSEQNEWLITRPFICPPNAELVYWTAAYSGGPNSGDNNMVRVSTNHGESWTVLHNLINMESGWNLYETPITQSLAAYEGQEIMLAWHAAENSNYSGLFSFWFIDNISVGELVFRAEAFQTVSKPEKDGVNPSRELMGYLVYRLRAIHQNHEDFWTEMATITSPDETYFLDEEFYGLIPGEEYQYAIKGVYSNNNLSPPAFSNTVTFVLSAEEDTGLPLLRTELLGNYPNPFNPETNISFSVERDCFVEIEVFNLKGQIVKTLVKDHLTRGFHSVVWNGRNKDNRYVGSGIYYYRLKAGDHISTGKMLLIK